MGSIYLQEVDELLILGYENFDGVLDVSSIGLRELFCRSLTRGLLAREVHHQVVDLRAILSDNIGGELLHGGVKSDIEPPGDKLGIPVKDIRANWVVADKRSCSAGND